MSEPSAELLAAAMAQAMTEALRGRRGATPVVGAVVIDADGTVLSSGHHRGAGTPHAEVDALARLAPEHLSRAEELTLVVTLEPCDHTGRTGPCTEAVLAANLGTVAYAVDDPTAAGGGAARLRAAGTRVIGPVDARAGHELNRRWFTARAAGRPFVTAHLAQSLDAMAADAWGGGRWITSAASREHAHAVRDRVDAIIVGTGTVEADDPSLTVRLPGRPEREVPVVIAGRRELDPSLRLLRRAAAGSVHRATSHDPHEILAAATDAVPGAEHVLVEGGPRLLSAFLAADLVDELDVYVAPTLLGRGVPALPGVSTLPLSRAPRLASDPAGGPTPRGLGGDVHWHLMPV